MDYIFIQFFKKTGVGVSIEIKNLYSVLVKTKTSLYGVNRFFYKKQKSTTSHGIVHYDYGVHRYKPIFWYDITVIAPRYVKVPSGAVDMNFRAPPACYP